MGGDATVATELPETLPNTRYGVKGSVCDQWRERNGKRYGPYYCLMWREGGRFRKRYLKREEADAVRAACAARQERERQRAETRALMVAALGAAAVSDARRQINATIRDAVGDNVTANQLRRLLYRR